MAHEVAIELPPCGPVHEEFAVLVARTLDCVPAGSDLIAETQLASSTIGTLTPQINRDGMKLDILMRTIYAQVISSPAWAHTAFSTYHYVKETQHW
jgi:hypothetical protein